MLNTHKCITMELGLIGEHEPHDWWYTSYGGGHELRPGWQPTDPEKGWDETEGWVKQWHCPGA
jgi:hypothetical protein